MDFLGLNWSCILLRSGQFAIMWQASWTYNISSFILRSFSHTFSSTCKKSFELEEEKGYFLIITHPFIFVNGSFEAKVLFFFFISLEFIISCILSDLTSCSSFIIVRSLASKWLSPSITSSLKVRGGFSWPIQYLACPAKSFEAITKLVNLVNISQKVSISLMLNS